MPGGEGVLVRVEAAGVCGTDVHIAVEGTLPTAFLPITLGHEIAGVVEEGAGEIVAGGRVCVYPHVPCLKCPFCLAGREALCRSSRIFGIQMDGGFGRYVRVPAECLVPLPESIPFEVGAALTDAVSTAYHAVVTRGRPQKGESVAVVGCGALGTFAIRILAILGVETVHAIDVDPHALERAKRAGAAETINAREVDAVREIKKRTGGGVDLGFEFVGSKASVRDAARCARPGGRVVVVGIGSDTMELMPIRSFVGNEITIMGSMGLDRRDLREVVAWTAEGRLRIQDEIEVHPLSEINEVFRRAVSGGRAASKCVVRP